MNHLFFEQIGGPPASQFPVVAIGPDPRLEVSEHLTDHISIPCLQ